MSNLNHPVASTTRVLSDITILSEYEGPFPVDNFNFDPFLSRHKISIHPSDMRSAFRTAFNPKRPCHMTPIQDLQYVIDRRHKLKINTDKLQKLILAMNREVKDVIDSTIEANGAGKYQYYAGVTKRDSSHRYVEHKKKTDDLRYRQVLEVDSMVEGFFKEHGATTYLKWLYINNVD
jgi:hypothetical protein